MPIPDWYEFEEERYCDACDELLPVELFHTLKNGLRSRTCQPCMQSGQHFKNYVWSRCNAGFSRAEKRGNPCEEISEDDALKLWEQNCQICGGEPEVVDHIIPIARGGGHVLSNLQMLCAKCNGSKGAKMPSEIESDL